MIFGNDFNIVVIEVEILGGYLLFLWDPKLSFTINGSLDKIFRSFFKSVEESDLLNDEFLLTYEFYILNK